MTGMMCPYCLETVQESICPHCGHDVHYKGRPNHLPVGYTLNGQHPYVLGAAIGQGGFGITYIALDVESNHRVAVKEYFPTHCCGRSDVTGVYPNLDQEETFAKGKERFLDEARMLKSLSDLDSVVNVLDFFEANNSAYLVMEYLDGLSLKDHVEKNGKMPAQAFLNQLNPLMADMEKMHQRGVVHRDIAPDNIILLPDGRLKLIDFGAARSYVGDKSMTVVVKKGFAPVEQYMRKGSNASTDVYALAATVYYCITGIIPPDSAERQYGEAELTAPTALGVELSAAQEWGLEKALEIQPRDRIQTVAALAAELDKKPKPKAEKTPKPRIEKAPKPKAEKSPKPKVEKTPKPQTAPVSKTEPKKKANWIIPVAAAALLLCVGVGFMFMGKEKPESQAPAQMGALQTPPSETEPPVQLSAEAVKYNEAVDFFHNREYGKAAIAFGKLGDYRDAKQISKQIWDAIAIRETLSAGGSHTVGIKNDGTVTACGNNNYGQCDVGDWTDIVAVSAGVDHTVGLRSDGTVVAAGMGGSDWINVSEWTDIVSVFTGYCLTVGVKSDGSIVTTATDNMLKEATYLSWTDVVALDFSYWWGSAGSVVALTSDGTSYSYSNIGTLCDIINIATESHLTAAVKSDGTVLTFKEDKRPWNQLNIDKVSDWNNIIAIDIGSDHILGLKSDGTAVACGDNSNKERNVEKWSDIVSISAGVDYSVGLKSDGTVVKAGISHNNLSAVSKWANIRLPADRDALLAAIELDYITEE